MRNTLDIYHSVFEFIIEARAVAQLYVGPGTDFRQLHEQCIPLLKRHVAVEIFLAESSVSDIEQDAVILSLLYQFKSQGGNLYKVADRDPLILCVIDYVRTLEVTTDGDEGGIAQEHAHRHGAYPWMVDPQGFLQQTDDILIWATVDKSRMFSRQQVIFSWEASHTDSLELRGFGELPLSGQKAIKIEEDTILSLRAVRGDLVRFRTLFVPAIRKAEVQYQLQFYNVASKQYEDLEAHAGSNVFGVVKGSILKLSWHVMTEGEVAISPFNLSDKSGEHEFFAEDYSQIKISAESWGHKLEKSIHIKEFPVPVFEQAFIPIDEHFLQSMKVSVVQKQQEAFDYVTAKGLMGHGYASHMLENCRQDEHLLMDRFQEIQFSEFYEKNSLPQLKLSIRQRLLRYFRDNAAVMQLIKNIRDYYG